MEPRWHPMLELVESEPAVWTLTGQYAHRYATITLVRREGVLCYRVEVLLDPAGERILLGYTPTLREAAERAHGAWIASRGPQGFAPNPWHGSP